MISKQTEQERDRPPTGSKPCGRSRFRLASWAYPAQPGPHRRTRVWSPAPCVVPAPPSGSPVAAQPGPVPCARVGAHAAADAGLARHAEIRRVPGSLPDARVRGARPAPPSRGCLGRARLLRPGAEPPPVGASGCGRNSPRPLWLRPAGYSWPGGDAPHPTRCPRETAGDRALHGGRGRVFRLRGRGTPRGHQRGTRPHAGFRSRRGSTDGGRTALGVGHRPGNIAAARRRGVHAQSGAHGAWRPHMHGARPALRSVPGPRLLPRTRGDGREEKVGLSSLLSVRVLSTRVSASSARRQCRAGVIITFSSVLT